MPDVRIPKPGRMRILAIETSGPIGSAALLDGEDVVRESHSPAPMRHLEWLMPAITAILDDAGWRLEEVEGLAVSRGPGSFTGLRIGMATAAAWARTRGTPVAGISTLDAIAAGLTAAPGAVCVIQDVRRGEFAGAVFARRDSEVTRLTEDLVGDLGVVVAVVPAEGPVLFAGDALEHVWAEVRDRLGPRALAAPKQEWSPRARAVGRLGYRRLAAGSSDDPYLLLPIYSRSPVR